VGQLFRDEALKAQGDRLLGEVVIAQPVSIRILVFFATFMFLCISLFIASATYARKETVTGYISPAHGIVRVNANQPGVVSALLVKEGDEVEVGTPLLKIEAARINDNGIQVNPEMIRSVEAQLNELDHLEKLSISRNGQQAQQLQAQLAGLEDEEAALRDRLMAQERLVEMTSSNLDRLRRLAGQGYVSSQDLAAKHEALLSAEQLLSALNQELASIRSSRRQTSVAIKQLPLGLEERQSELRNRRSDLELRRLQLTQQGPMTIVAPVAGIVSAASVVVGDSISDQQNLLTLLPAGSALEAHLYVPTRAIGFVAKGQEVRILYDAFDYRRYGAQKGKVHEISSAILPASETFRRVQRNEPSYKVRVVLSDQVFRLEREELKLQPGMTLRADIILEHRTLLSWLANPVLALRGRT
jgi:membrane fusion protein